MTVSADLKSMRSQYMGVHVSLAVQFGLTTLLYLVHENDTIEVCVELVGATLELDITVSLEGHLDTAVGKMHGFALWYS